MHGNPGRELPARHAAAASRDAVRERRDDRSPWSDAVADEAEGDAAVTDTSDRLLDAVDQMRTLEAHKRHIPISTPEFRDTAIKVERKAREALGIARAEREIGEALRARDETIEDQADRERRQ
jgi:hypothetical protein